MYSARACLRAPADVDRRGGHNLLLRFWRERLRAYPLVRDLLPDHADDITDDHTWAEHFIQAKAFCDVDL